MASKKPDRQLVAAPTVASVQRYYNPPLSAVALPKAGKEILVVGTAVFQGVDPRMYEVHRGLAVQLGADYGSNVWLIPIHERMPFPDACIFCIAAMFNMERACGRKADWFFWLEDDVAVPMDVVRRLRAAADPVERPFVAVVGLDRVSPFPPAVWELRDGKTVQWTLEDIPDDGLHQVDATGLTCCLIHRSVFDRVPEPWFAAGSSMINFTENGVDVHRGIKPDNWFSNQLRKAGVPVYVHAGIDVTHLAARMPINRHTAALFRDLPGFGRQEYEHTCRGRTESFASVGQRDGGPVPAGVRQGGPSGVESGHVAVDESGGAVPPGATGGVGMPQAPAAARPELSGSVGAGQQTGLWGGWTPLTRGVTP